MIVFGCSAAETLFEHYISATTEYFQATHKLCNLVGLHDQFDAAQQQTEQAGAKCRAALLAIEKHRVEHNCS